MPIYIVDKRLGKGGFGQVCLGRRLQQRRSTPINKPNRVRYFFMLASLLARQCCCWSQKYGMYCSASVGLSIFRDGVMLCSKIYRGGNANDSCGSLFRWPSNSNPQTAKGAIMAGHPMSGRCTTRLVGVMGYPRSLRRALRPAFISWCGPSSTNCCVSFCCAAFPRIGGFL